MPARLGLILAVLGAVLVASPARAAVTLSVDFETGPALGTPVEDQYVSTAFVRWLKDDPGFRPYRRNAPAQARSGTTVADVGNDVCPQETGGTCEFVTPASQGRLTRTASTVTLYAGLFQPTGGFAVSARLVAYNANGDLVGQSAAVPIDANGFDNAVTVTSPNADIQRFDLLVEGDGASGATLGYDDLTITYPDNAVPDVAVGVSADWQTVLQGRTLDVAVTLTRVNGSNGPIDLKVSGLPQGVTGTFTPDPVPGTQSNATLRLTATPTAPPFFEPVQATVTADPQGNINVAPATRNRPLMVRVRSNFDLSRPSTDRLLLPHCAPVDTTLNVLRDPTFNGTVTLTAEQLPPGVTAEFLPGAAIPPGGNFLVEPTLRVRRGTERIPLGAAFRVRAAAPSAPDRTLLVPIGESQPTASTDTGRGLTPRRMSPGTKIRVSGNGFCPGTRVKVGNDEALADTEVEPELTGLTFNVPRLGTTGPVTILPPGPNVPGYATTNSLLVASFRNSNGFQFDNFGYEHLSFGELTDLVGPDEMFLRVNPCWPFGTCHVPTGIPDPFAYVVWGVLELALRSSGGHCFGINRTIQEVLAGRFGLNQWTGGATSIFELPAATGPSGSLASHLDSRHAAQGTAEFLNHFLFRDDSLRQQVDRVRSELEAGRYPGVSIRKSTFTGHVVTAYDVETQPDGTTLIYVYDNNRPYVPASDEAADGFYHRRREVEQSVIKISPGVDRWEMDMGGETWSGGVDGSLFTIPYSYIPDDPTLPGYEDLHLIIGLFGSTGGAARSTGPPAGAELLPALDPRAIPGAGGFLVAPDTARTLTHTLEGAANGTYSQAFTGTGFAAAVRDVATAPGVTDKVTGDPGAGGLTFTGEQDRPLTIDLADQLGTETTHAATVTTRTFSGGSDTAELRGGTALAVAHNGPATTMAFELSSVTRGKGVARFVSGPLRIGKGERVTARPGDWSALGSVRLEIRRANGRRVTRTLRNRAKALAVGITVARPTLRRVRTGTEGGVAVSFARVPADAVGGVVLKVQRGRRTVATRSLSVASLAAGRRTFRSTFPRLSRGTYRITAYVTVATATQAAATRRVTRTTTIRLR